MDTNRQRELIRGKEEEMRRKVILEARKKAKNKYRYSSFGGNSVPTESEKKDRTLR